MTLGLGPGKAGSSKARTREQMRGIDRAEAQGLSGPARVLVRRGGPSPDVRRGDRLVEAGMTHIFPVKCEPGCPPGPGPSSQPHSKKQHCRVS